MNLRPSTSKLKFSHPTFQEWRQDLKASQTLEEEITFIKQTLRHKTNLHIFGRLFFPHIIRGEVETPDFHLELIEFLSSPNDGAAIEPRSFAKSTWEKIDSLHDIVYALEPVMVYGSDSMSAAQLQLEGIKSELENNGRLRQVYGDLVPLDANVGRKWTNTHFETSNGVNMLARGRGKGRGINIKNKRPTKIILDDVETDESVHSDEQRRKTHDWIYNVIIPSLDRERGRIKMIGTVIHPQCEVLAFYKAKGGVFRRAIEDGKSLWPAYWPLEALYRVRDGYVGEDGRQIEGIGLRAFSQEFLNEPINTDTSVFNRQSLERNTYEVLPPLEWLEIRMAIDPNAGQSKMADFMGLCVMGRDKRDNKRYVLEARKFKGKITSLDPKEETQESIFDSVYTRWDPLIAGIECVRTMGIALYQILSSKNKYRLTVVTPEGKDKVSRAQRIEPFVEQDIIKFSTSHVDLYNEMIVFPNGEHDDVCLVADTLVLTRSGNIKIRDVVVGMEVMTRSGWQKVVQAGVTGRKQVVTNLGITGTWNHPVITTKGAKRLANVTADDMIYAWNQITSSIEVRNITATRTASGGNYGFTFIDTIKTKLHHLLCTARFGLITLEQYLRDLLFITLTVIRLIMQSAILRVSMVESTCPNTCLNQTKLSYQEKTSLLLKRQLRHGTQAQRGELGIQNMQQENSKQSLIEYAWSAAKTFWQSIKIEKSVHQDATEGVQDVYNLQIEGAHEFFANDILVHNCDAFIMVNDMFTSNRVELDNTKRPGITAGLRTMQF